jgi:cytosine deaminase
MCTGTTLLHRVPRVVIGENSTFVGGEELFAAHGVELVNLNDQRCVALMKAFIESSPDLWQEDIGDPEA